MEQSVSKSVLVMDTPESCKKCIYSSMCSSISRDRYCVLLSDIILQKYVDLKGFRLSNCPLKELPEESTEDTDLSFVEDYQLGYKNGWNDCIRAILGGDKGE